MKKLTITGFALFLAIAAEGGVLSGQTQGDSGLTEHLKNLEHLESSIK